MATSFNTNGATPKLGQGDLNLGGLINSWKPQKQNQDSGLTLPPSTLPLKDDSIAGSPTPQIIPGLIPTTPVKKITNNNTDGSSTTHEFHAPDAVSGENQNVNQDGTNGIQKPIVPPIDPNAPVANSTPGTNGNNGSNFQQNLTNIQNASNLNSNPEYQNLAQMNNQLVQEQTGAKTAGIGGTPIPGLGLNNANYQNLFTPQTTASLQGGENVFNTNNAIQMAGNAAEAQRLLSGGQLATQGATSVAGLTAPQYGVQPGTLVGQPGQPSGGIDQNYLGGIAAPANMQAIRSFTDKINTTENSRDTLKSLGSKIIPNMGTTGFNPTSSPIGNQTFAQYFKEKDPAATAGIQEGLVEIKNQISNIISSSTGLTPTGVTNALGAVDIMNLNPQQLNDFLLYIDQYAQSNMDAAQKSIDRINSGGKVDSNPGLLPAPSANSTGQAALGTGATVIGATAGAASGLAKKVLGI